VLVLVKEDVRQDMSVMENVDVDVLVVIVKMQAIKIKFLKN